MLTRREHFVLEMRKAGLTCEEIARLVGATEDRIKRVEKGAVRKLRKLLMQLRGRENGEEPSVCH